MNITKEKFIEAYNSFPPNEFTKFVFKYFSKSTKEEDSWLNKIVTGILISLFLAGFIGTILDFGRPILAGIIYTFSGMLSILVIGLFTGVFMNNWRIRKIRKKLGGISKSDYNFLSDKYLS
jgi:hypothetical protein